MDNHSVTYTWTVACQAPLSTEFSRQKYWSVLPFPSPGIFLTQGSNLGLHCRQTIYRLRRTDAEAPILWPPDGKSWLTGKDPDAGKDWGQEDKGVTEGEMVGWHHLLNGHESEQTPGRPGVLQSTGLQSQTRLSDWTTNWIIIFSHKEEVNSAIFHDMDKTWDHYAK